MATPAILFSDGLIESIQATLPELLLDLIVLVTMLGDQETYVVVLLVFFYAIDREKGVALIAVGLTVAALTPGLKEAFGIPRPPDQLHWVHAEHYGVPSGHTLGAFAIYGALIYAVDRWSLQFKAFLTALVGTAVGLSRIVLGVHYPADVLAGFAIAIVLLVLFVYWAQLEPERTFLVAGLLVLPIAVLFWDLPEIYFGLGGLIGAAAGWTIGGDVGTIDVSRSVGLVAVAAGVLVVLVVTILLEQAPVHPLPVAVVVGLVAVAYPDLYHEVTNRMDRGTLEPGPGR